ncbi:MAG: hypothetical protein AB4060_11695 [Crocosphaera sp.]
MIKLSIKIITLASLTVGLGLYFVPQKGFSVPFNQIKSTQIPNNIVPVALPYDATVTLKTGGTMSGKIIMFDSQQSKITIQRSGKKAQISITDIDNVKFEGEFIFIHTGLVLPRGETNSCYNQQNNSSLDNGETWQEPLTHFKITNGQDGKAEVILSKENETKLEGIITIYETNTYVINELGFNHDNNNIIVNVIPCSEESQR